MAGDHFIVIGNGPAGSQAAFTLREKAPDAEVSIITREREGCCHSHLLPKFLAGTVSKKDLFAISFDDYIKKGIKLRTGQSIVNVDISKREVLLDHKEILPFSGLIIAVGGKPRIPEPLLVFKDLLYPLKSFSETTIWQKKLLNVDSILMLGGDLTSLAVTKALLTLEKKIYFMLNEDAFWPLRFNKTLYKEVSRKLTEKGVEVLTGLKIKSIARISEDVCRVRIDDQEIEAGLIGAFFGLVPDVKFLVRSGLQIDRGILVDEYLSTGIEGIYATGDCAQIYHPELHDYWISIGTKNAKALGRLAAVNLLGGMEKTKVSKESIFDIDGIKVNTSWWSEF